MAQHIIWLLLSDFTSNPLQAKRNSNMHISFLHIFFFWYSALCKIVRFFPLLPARRFRSRMRHVIENRMHRDIELANIFITSYFKLFVRHLSMQTHLYSHRVKANLPQILSYDFFSIDSPMHQIDRVTVE